MVKIFPVNNDNLKSNNNDLKSNAWLQNRTTVKRDWDLYSQVWFQTAKIAQHEVQFPLDHIHFEILILNNFVKWEQSSF
jgi:hypothetical protein